MSDALKDLDFTQLMMAKKLGWRSSQYVCSIASGAQIIPPNKWKRFARVTGIDEHELLESWMAYKRTKVMQQAGLTT